MQQKQEAPVSKEKQPVRWARTAGDRLTVSAKGSPGAGQYLQDLDCEMSESIRFKPAGPGDARLRSVTPSCCAKWSDRPRQTGQIQLNTGRMEIGCDKKTHELVFGFVRHEMNGLGREVLENKARVCNFHDKARFRSNDRGFRDGAMELRCEAARTPKKVLRQFGRMSDWQGGETTMDRVLPFQQTEEDRNRAARLREREHRETSGRSNLHTAASGASVLAVKKEQRQTEFRKKAVKAIQQAKQSARKDDYLSFVRKKWERMRLEAALESIEQSPTAPAAPVKNQETERS